MAGKHALSTWPRNLLRSEENASAFFNAILAPVLSVLLFLYRKRPGPLRSGRGCGHADEGLTSPALKLVLGPHRGCVPRCLPSKPREKCEQRVFAGQPDDQDGGVGAQCTSSSWAAGASVPLSHRPWNSRGTPSR
ncbi:predicted protein [Streptomyces filamentosus NRRL 15998]|uniref:Predicted protein n=1 Tax=Streptomyces filamentosus NRRL 15998 TaxID=457431 RepID=D6ATD0_STRFL|nr:predicted protein [Streptomyces filamentosus NRRL 15998]